MDPIRASPPILRGSERPFTSTQATTRGAFDATTQSTTHPPDETQGDGAIPSTDPSQEAGYDSGNDLIPKPPRREVVMLEDLTAVDPTLDTAPDLGELEGSYAGRSLNVSTVDQRQIGTSRNQMSRTDVKAREMLQSRTEASPPRDESTPADKSGRCGITCSVVIFVSFVWESLGQELGIRVRHLNIEPDPEHLAVADFEDEWLCRRVFCFFAIGHFFKCRTFHEKTRRDGTG